MGKPTFILDRVDYQRMAAMLPEDAHRTELEARLREAHDAYTGHYDRRAALEEAIQEARLKLVGNADPKASAHLTALLAEQSLWPDVLVERAETYAKALVAWAKDTHAAFTSRHNAAVDAINAYAPERGRLHRIVDTLPKPDSYDEAQARLSEIAAELRPHVETRDAMRQAVAIVETTVHRLFPNVTAVKVTPHDVAAWVNRHRQRQTRAAA